MTAQEKLKRAEAVLDAQDGRTETRDAVVDKGTDEDTIPITEAAMLGMAETFIIGPRESVILHLKAPSIRISGKFRAMIVQKWPDVLIAAAIGDRGGKGIDLTKTARFWQERMEYDNERRATTGEVLLTIPDLADLIAEGEKLIDQFTDEISTYNFAAVQQVSEDGSFLINHMLDDICNTVWELAKDDNEHISRETLPAYLADNLTVVEFADLLRAILRACSGSDTAYESDITSRFFDF